MKSAFMKIGVAGFVLAMPLVGITATDAEIKERIVDASTVIDDGDLAWSTLHSAIDLCEGDTNRFERVLRSLVDESLENGNARMAESAMWKIGYFGTTNSLPFLYGCATNAAVGGEAMLSAVKIGGFTSDNVEQLRSFVSTPSIPLDKRIYYFRECVRHPSIADISLADRALLAGSVIQCATTANDWVHALDEGISLLDPTYLHSKRRLAVMRSVVNLDLNDYDVNFVTNTINELVAYPESALGD